MYASQIVPLFSILRAHFVYKYIRKYVRRSDLILLSHKSEKNWRNTRMRFNRYTLSNLHAKKSEITQTLMRSYERFHR